MIYDFAIVLKGSAMIKTGGCLCGETRYQTNAEPLRSSVCHCRYCQLRTGSAFGVSIYFQDDEVNLLSGKLDYFSYSTESGIVTVSSGQEVTNDLPVSSRKLYKG